MARRRADLSARLDRLEHRLGYVQLLQVVKLEPDATPEERERLVAEAHARGARVVLVTGKKCASAEEWEARYGHPDDEGPELPGPVPEADHPLAEPEPTPHGLQRLRPRGDAR